MSDTKLSLKQITIDVLRDETLRKYVFNGLTVENKTIRDDLISHMSNIMLLAFWGYFLVWRENFDNIPAKTISEKRIDNCFRKIYSGGALSHETISYILTEIQIDVFNKGSKSIFYGLINNNVKESVFQSIAEIIRIWRIRYRRANQGVEKLTQYYLTLLNCLEILKGMRLYDKDDKLYMQVSVPRGYDMINYPKEPADMSLFIRHIENEETYEDYYFYLYKAEGKGIKNENGKRMVRCTYLSFDGSCSYTSDESDCFMPISEFYARNGLRFYSRQDSDVIKNLNVHDFKYMHRLALAISDALSDDARERIFKHVTREDSNYPASLKCLSEEEINWDNIVILFMLEEGPSELIEFILKNNMDLFTRILESLPLRFKMKLSAEQLKKKFEEANACEQKYQNKVLGVLGVEDALSEWDRNAQIEFRAQFIISAVMTENSDSEDITLNAFYAESLSLKEKKLNAVLARGNSIETVHAINKVLERLFRMLILFYRGLLAYAEKRQEIYDDIVDKDTCIKRDFILETQQKCENAFFAKVESLINEPHVKGNTPLLQLSLGQLISAFYSLCDEMESHDKNITTYHHPAYLLHSVIGRRAICDTKTLDKILESNAEDFKGIKKFPPHLIGFINSVKHDGEKEYKDINRITDIFAEYLHELFLFLTFNGDYKDESKKQIQSIYDPVFPYIVRYSEKSENRDMCSVSHYVINVDGGYDKMQEIKLLTEYEYTINELYYCIPNCESSTKSWWVTPFLISCRKFDSLVLKIDD